MYWNLTRWCVNLNSRKKGLQLNNLGWIFELLRNSNKEKREVKEEEILLDTSRTHNNRGSEKKNNTRNKAWRKERRPTVKL